jgi:hypothetical protein
MHARVFGFSTQPQMIDTSKNWRQQQLKGLPACEKLLMEQSKGISSSATNQARLTTTLL